MTTKQIRRLYYPEGEKSEKAVKSASKRNLKRLQKYGLIDHLPKRLGGFGAGMKEYIWYVTEAGIRLLELSNGTNPKRKRVLEPSPTFLRHTVAVAETFVQIIEICNADPAVRVRTIDVEPSCWRGYQKNGKTISLRPDMYAETATGEYNDHMFIEMDLATEAPQTIADKCRRYYEYYQTGKEQQVNGAFPLVLWIVQREERKDCIIQTIKDYFKGRYPHIFYVITPEELEHVILDGVEKEKLC
ncbi:replication-relaxation family protein [Candidatus Saccharibacteria bacterium]|nr:replication-relaxation family protein [Candidatus Saccharibacteria bacterium]